MNLNDYEMTSEEMVGEQKLETGPGAGSWMADETPTSLGTFPKDREKEIMLAAYQTVFDLLNERADKTGVRFDFDADAAQAHYYKANEGPAGKKGKGGGEDRRVSLTRASTVDIYRQDFLLDPLLPLETITIVSGRGGEGKSTLALHWAAMATRGQLPGVHYGQPVNVAVSAHEDSKSIQTARLSAAGADMNRVVFLDVHEGDKDQEVSIRFPLDQEMIGAALAQEDVKLWVIDPVLKLVEGQQSKSEDVREALDALHALAARLHISVLGIAHFNKGEGNAGNKLSGSHAIRDVIRSHIPLALDSETETRVYTLEKSNYSEQRGKSWQFQLVSRDVPTIDGKTLAVGVVDELGESPISVDQIINRAPEREDEDRNEAQAFLLDYLNSQGGEAPAGDVLKAGRAAGFGDSQLKTARRRSKDPKVSTRKGGGKGVSWVWAIDTFDFSPPHQRKVATETAKVSRQPVHDSEHDTLDQNRGTFPRDSNEKPKVSAVGAGDTLENVSNPKKAPKTFADEAAFKDCAAGCGRALEVSKHPTGLCATCARKGDRP